MTRREPDENLPPTDRNRYRSVIFRSVISVNETPSLSHLPDIIDSTVHAMANAGGPTADSTTDSTPKTIEINDNDPAPVPNPPSSFYRSIPSAELSVHAFLEREMPTILPGRDPPEYLKPENAGICIVSRKAQYKMKDVFTAEIPPIEWVDALCDSFKARQDHLNLVAGGRHLPRLNTAVQHPLRKRLFFPPWIINAWNHLRPFAQDWARWKRTSEWLANLSPTARTIEMQDIISQTQWGTPVSGLLGHYADSRVSHLAILASGGWIPERLLDLFAKMVNTGLESQEWLVAEPLVTAYILKVERGGKGDFTSHGTLREITAKLESGHHKRLLLPANVAEGTHWVLFQVDLEAKTLAWGA